MYFVRTAVRDGLTRSLLAGAVIPNCVQAIEEVVITNVCGDTNCCETCPPNTQEVGSQRCPLMVLCMKRTCCQISRKETCLVCATGFALNAAKTACVDVNECLGSPCNSLRVCVNTEGSFFCTDCPAGYRNDGSTGCLRAARPLFRARLFFAPSCAIIVAC